MFAFGIVAIQIALQVIWFQVEPGVAALDYSDPEFTLLQCQYSSYLGPSVAISEFRIRKQCLNLFLFRQRRVNPLQTFNFGIIITICLDMVLLMIF